MQTERDAIFAAMRQTVYEDAGLVLAVALGDPAWPYHGPGASSLSECDAIYTALTRWAFDVHDYKTGGTLTDHFYK